MTNLATDSTQNDVATRVRGFIVENFVLASGASADQIKGSDSLRELGLLDSTGVLELIAFLEETFQIQVRDEETIPDNLDSLDKVVAFVGRKRAEP